MKFKLLGRNLSSKIISIQSKSSLYTLSTKAWQLKAIVFQRKISKFVSPSFPGLSIEKLKAGVFDGPQIRKLLKDFVESMTPVQSDAWRSFEQVVKKLFR